MAKTVSPRSVGESILYALGAGFLAFTIGCAQAPTLQDSLSATQDGGDGRTGGDDSGRITKGFPNPTTAAASIPPSPEGPPVTGTLQCSKPEAYSSTFTPSSIRGANVIFLIDDSGSMNEEIQWVIDQVGTFINRINTATNANYRFILVYDYSKGAFRNVTFRDPTGAIIDSVVHPNPLDYLADNKKVFYFKRETWSKWADIAFFRAFAPRTYMQTLPTNLLTASFLLDRPPSGVATVSSSSCSGQGKYFRPRYAGYGDNNFGSTPACISASGNAVDLSSLLIKETSVNFISLSDDDLNVEFDRANFEITDNSKNAYPEVILNMLNDLIKPLGSNLPVRYHSIVGLPSSNSSIANIGAAHLALTKKTGGFYHDIEDRNYQTAFNGIANNVIFGEQVITLPCPIGSAAPQVSLGGRMLPADQFSFTVGKNVIRLSPSAFAPSDIDKTLTAVVTY